MKWVLGGFTRFWEGLTLVGPLCQGCGKGYPLCHKLDFLNLVETFKAGF